jgi:hypothetical protein
MRTKFYLSGLAGSVVFFLLGWFVYEILLMNFYTANTYQYEGLMMATPKIWVLVLSILVQGFFLAFLFERWAGISTFKGGLIAGLITGLFVTAMFDLSVYSMMHLYRGRLVIADILISAVVWAIAGGVEGWILNKKDVKE